MYLDKDSVQEFVDNAVGWYEEESMLGNGVSVRTDDSHKVALNKCRQAGKTDANSLNMGTALMLIKREIAQHELTKLDGEIEDVTLGDTPIKTVSLELDGADSLGTTIVSGTTGTISVTVGEEVVYSGDLGLVEYEHSGVRIAYQAGGVWRQSPGGYSGMVLAPPFTAENISTATLSIPITVIVGTDGLSDGAVIERVDAEQVYPTLNDPEGEAVQISIQSIYYKAWARYFVERLNISKESVVTIPDENRVTLIYGEDQRVFLHITMYRVKISAR